MAEGNNYQPVQNEINKRSFVWKHFYLKTGKGPTELAQCKYCIRKYVFAGKGTCYLIRHLKRQHAYPKEITQKN